MFRGNAFQCYIRATHLQPVPSSESTPVGQAGALLDCVRTYCSEMQSAKCPMPLFGKDNAGFCFTTTTDDPDVTRQSSAAGHYGDDLSSPRVTPPVARGRCCR
jgi:hypothetical protein